MIARFVGWASVRGSRRAILPALLSLSLLLGFASAAAAQTCPVPGAGKAGATVTMSALARALEGIQVAETGAFTDTYTVKLDSRPSHDVVVTATSSLKPLPAHWRKPLKPPGDAVELRVAGASAWRSTVTLRFTPSNWCRAQTVTMKGIDDDIHNAPGGARRAIIAHEADSGDDDYDGISIESLEVMAFDNEPSWRLIPDVAATRVAEGGTVDVTFTVRPVRKLWKTPVKFTLAPTSGASNPAENADLPKAREMTVTIPANTPTLKTSFTLPDDLLDEGDETFTVTFHKPWGIDFIEQGRWGSRYRIDVVIIDDDGPPPTTPQASFASGSQSAAESAGTRNVTVNLSPVPKAAISLDYTVGGTAASGADYKALSGTVAVSSGASSVTIPVVLVDDAADEASETVVLTLKAGSGYAVAKPSVHTLTITDDDDPLPEVTIAADAASKTEGADASFTLTANPPPASALAVKVGVAVKGDYGVTAGDRTVTIPKTGSAKLTLTTTGDTEDEPDGSVTVTVKNGNGYTVGVQASSTVSILDDDDPPLPEVTIAADAASKTEGAAASFTLTANPPPASALAVKVGVAVKGNFGVTAGDRTVTIPKTGSAKLTLATTGDTEDEPDGSVTVTLVTGDGYTVGSPSSGVVSILDDDDAPPQADEPPPAEVDPALVAAIRGYIAEPNRSAEHVERWKRVLKAFGETDSDLAGLTPMTAAEAQIHADKGWTRWDEIVTALTTLEQAPATPEVNILTSAGGTEGTDASFTITANPPPAAPLAVDVSIAASGDFGVTPETRTVTIPTTGSYTLTLPTTDDAVDEPDGSVTLTVEAGSGYTVGSASSETVAILDDDAAAATAAVDPALVAKVRGYAGETSRGTVHVTRWKRVLKAFGETDADLAGLEPMTASEAKTYAGRGWTRWDEIVTALTALENAAPDTTAQTPEVTIAADAASATEGGNASFTLTASPPPAVPLAVTVSVAATGDYGVTTETRTVTIPATGSFTLTVPTANDGTDEPDGSVTASLASGNGYTVGTPYSGTVAVLDDDVASLPAVSIAADAASVTEGGSASFTLTAYPPPASPLAVSVSVAASGDWGVATGGRSVTIPTSGSYTLTLPTTGDALDEPDGSVTATVKAGDGYTVGAQASGMIAILDDDDAPLPQVTIAADAASKTEGADASFTLTANPPPASALAVKVTVATKGDYGVTAGDRTVTIPTTGSVKLTLATTGDTEDEPDGSVTVTVAAGDGYTVGTASSGTVAIEDDDLPPPEITIAADAAAITEGGVAAFTVTADRAPDADLAVTLAVSEAAGSDFVAAGDEGPAAVTIPKGGTEAAFTVTTVDDAVDEPDGTVTVMLAVGDGYTLGASASAAVPVADNDAAPALPVVSLGDDLEVPEHGVFAFRVTLSAAAAHEVRVSWFAETETARYADFAPISGSVRFSPGERAGAFYVFPVNDAHDEDAETFRVVLQRAEGATIGDGVAVGTIVNSDPMPAAWLSRFGRTVAEQALDGIAGRMSADRTPGMQGTLAGQALSFDPAASGPPASDREAALAMADVARGFDGSAGGSGSFGNADPFGGLRFGGTQAQSRTMTARDALLGSSFSLTGARDGAGGSMAFWGRAGQGSFDGRERGDGTDISLDGEVTTGMLGADYARGRWLAGLALTQSSAEGSYAAIDGGDPVCPEVEGGTPALCDGAVRAGDGKVEASLTAAIPYVSFRASERLKLWGATGYGSGEVTLKTADQSYRTDTTWSMAAAGMRSDLLVPPAEGSGPALVLTSDALWARTSSEDTRDLRATESDVTRLRLGIEGRWRMALEGGGHLTPKAEVGARHDGGDAETGFGVELGGGVGWTDPTLGLSLDLSGRTLLAHEDGDLKDRGYAASLAFDPAPATQRGPSLSLRQDFGGRAQGGLDALFAPEALEDRTGSEATSRWSMEAAYGFPAFGGRFTGSPHVGLGLATGARDYSLGWRLTSEAATAPDFSFGFRATRRESDTAEAEHVVGFESVARW